MLAGKDLPAERTILAMTAATKSGNAAATSIRSRPESETKPKSATGRSRNGARAVRLAEMRIECIENPLFARPEAAAAILGADDVATISDQPGIVTAPASDRGELGAYMAAMYDTCLLTREQESRLFRRMNYLKWRAAKLQPRLAGRDGLAKLSDEIERLLADALQIRQRIIECNLRLVVSVAKRFAGTSMALDELISEGNLTLFKAVEKFDYSLGNKFSTYATWALRRSLARAVSREQLRRQRFACGDEDSAEPSDQTEEADAATGISPQAQPLLRQVLRQLEQRDRAVLFARFGLASQGEPRKLQHIADEMGISKERVRQLQIRALERLRRLAAQAGLTAQLALGDPGGNRNT